MEREGTTFAEMVSRCILRCTLWPFLLASHRIGIGRCTFYRPGLFPYPGVVVWMSMNRVVVAGCSVPASLPSMVVLVAVVVAEGMPRLRNLVYCCWYLQVEPCDTPLSSTDLQILACPTFCVLAAAAVSPSPLVVRQIKATATTCLPLQILVSGRGNSSLQHIFQHNPITFTYTILPYLFSVLILFNQRYFQRYTRCRFDCR
mmetsp:Transcript_19804/g.45181  ORF Transcript_19804/g.45181 Transcript_19804/m.45181 type:complete len:202 (+) Transcript_19804:991-1596(+)